MHTLNRTGSRKVPRPHATVEQKLWYVPDRRIQTRLAARRAIEIAEWARTGENLETEPDEHAIFAAFHTCAFKATRRSRNRRAQREQWSGRWHHIREHIVRNNLGLVYVMLSRLKPHDQDEDDRLSEAMYGLCRAVDRFDPWKGYRFSTYACSVIARALMRCGRREKRYRQLFPAYYDVFFERPSGSSDFGAELYAERLSRALEENLAELTPLEARVIAQRFPRSSAHRHTFREIGNAVGLSKERVRQVQNQALAKLREALATDPVLQ
jgi:RNA polymerase sigma factor (sigma-70 family)